MAWEWKKIAGGIVGGMILEIFRRVIAKKQQRSATDAVVGFLPASGPTLQPRPPIEAAVIPITWQTKFRAAFIFIFSSTRGATSFVGLLVLLLMIGVQISEHATRWWHHMAGWLSIASLWLLWAIAWAVAPKPYLPPDVRMLEEKRGSWVELPIEQWPRWARVLSIVLS